MKCAACKQDLQDGEPLLKIHTYHSFNDSVNGYPEGYIHLLCPSPEAKE